MTKVSIVSCTALVMSSMIGTGVFTSLGFQLETTDSSFIIFLLWMLGGVLALCGAFSYSLLCRAFPHSGGEYNFLSHLYHPALGFMAGLLSATVGFAAPIALTAMTLSGYLKTLFPGLTPLAVSLSFVGVIAVLHLFSIRLESILQNSITFLNVTLILLFIIIGLDHPQRQSISFWPRNGDLNYVFSQYFAVSLMYVTYSYLGWNAAAYILGEVTDAKRAAGRGLLVGAAATTALYIGLNAVFLLTTPTGQLRGNLEVGQIAARQILGDAGGAALSALLCLILCGSISSIFWTGTRVIAAMANNIDLLSFFAKTNAGGAPVRAILLMLGLVVTYLATASFKSALLFTGFILSLSSTLCVAGVFLMAWRQAEEGSSIFSRVLLPPLFFVGANVFFLAQTLRERPRESGLSLLLALCFYLLYFPLAKWRRAAVTAGLG